ncbi:transcriptional regulator [Actinoplanes philippinensis]|uniref:LacI family transcriptional regulator n=1 Tax=Actinoplanes philippinensis TaxID=35752 RepID=A0A1I2L2J7_9ACTN|nr:substrate-binding domain-containing protein [Actinoplanes philippinensis]GIE80783.1 transcriptional regulator [Actinoplanes philippinensis]SFF71677.1 LacI family transcriptional regulator [Actinoplanes philippinensis]
MTKSDGSATIALIASDVGVSVTTVSKVLNGRSDVAARTRALVEASLQRHGYRRRSRRPPAVTGHVDLVFHEFDTAWCMEVIRGVEEVTSPARVELVISQLGGRHRPPRHWADDVLHRSPLGVLLVLCHPTESQRRLLIRQRIPFVVLDSDSATAASVPTVGSNNFDGGLLATRHLIDLGHRRIAVISGPSDVLCSRARVAGFRSAHDEAGLPLLPHLVRYGAFTGQAGYEHGMQLLAAPDRPTAVFAGSDTQAMGVIRAARRLGLQVPADVSIVGYDNVPMAAWAATPLTTVDQHVADMGGAAARMLLDLARGVDVPMTRVDLVTELIVRETTAPPPPLPAAAPSSAAPPQPPAPALSPAPVSPSPPPVSPSPSPSPFA